MARLPRRAFLKGVGGTAAAVATVGASTHAALAQELPGGGPFLHGVASGDPLADAVIIWTRITPTNEATPGSGVGPPLAVDWEIARDPEFDMVVDSGTRLVNSTTDHTLHVDVKDLTAGTDHWYRFHALGHTSPVGRTRTLPAIDAPLGNLRLGVVSCAEWEFGYFAAYRHLARRDDLDAILHLGDYIYEFGRDYSSFAATPGATLDPPRNHEPPHELHALADYRTRYGQYHGDPDLQALHAAHPFILMYDDHEIANDTWSDGAEQHDASEGDFALRAAEARRAWREWLPLRPPDAADLDRAYRRVRFGDLVDMWVVDTRRHRSEHAQNAIIGYFSVDPAVDSPDRTLLGAAQLAWLLDGFNRSEAAWKVLGSPVPFYPFFVGTELLTALDAAYELGEFPPLPPPLSVDDWNGYRYEQGIVIDAMAAITDVVALTGDTHESTAADIPSEPDAYRLDGNSVGVEFSVPSVTSPGLSDTLAGAGLPVSDSINVLYETNLATANPWVAYHEGFSSGYGIVEFTAEHTHYDFWLLENKQDRETGAVPAASFQSLRGTDRLLGVDAPMPERGRPASPPILPAVEPVPLPDTGAGAVAAGLLAVGTAAALRSRRPAGPAVVADAAGETGDIGQ